MIFDGAGNVPVPTLVPVAIPAVGAGIALGAVTEAGFGGLNAPLGPGLIVSSGNAAVSVVPGAAASLRILLP